MDRWLKYLERYPTSAALLVLSCGILTARSTHEWIHLWAIASLVASLCLVLICVHRNWKFFLWLAVCLLFYFIGITFSSAQLQIGNTFIPPSRRCLIHASVVDVVSSGPDFLVVLVESGIIINDNKPLPGLGRLYVQNNKVRLCGGDRVAFRSYLRKPRNRGNPGEFDWEMYCLNNGIRWLGSIRGTDSILILKRGSKFRPKAVLFGMRRRMAEFLDEHSSDKARAVLKGIVLGDRGELDYELRAAFSESGLAHLLSASGLHVGVIALFITGVVFLVTVPKPETFLQIPRTKLAAVLSVPAMSVYCLLVGARIPAVRATILGMVFAIAILADRRWHSINSLALTALIILLLYPFSIYSVSFHLSFAAVLGILLTVPHLMSRLNNATPRIMQDKTEIVSDDLVDWTRRQFAFGARGLAAFMFTSLAATFAVSPFLLRWFHFFPVYSLLANITAGLLLTIVLPIGLISAGVGALYPPLGKLALIPAEFFTKIMIDIANFFASFPGSAITIPPPGDPEFYAAIILVFVLLWIFGKSLFRRKVALLIICAGLVSCLFIIPWLRSGNDTLKVVFLNVGKGDACLITPPGHKGFLIDAGWRGLNFDSGQSVVLPYLGYRGVRSLDGVMISHPQMDHMGGLQSVMNKIHTKVLWWNPVQIQSTFLNQLLDHAQLHGTNVLKADRRGACVRFGETVITFLNRPQDQNQIRARSRDMNNSSIVCRLDFGDVSFLFTGDIEAEAEQELLASGLPLQATVLKVPHHGCNTGCSAQFVKAASPRIAVISSGYGKLGRCPAKDILQRLEAVTDHVYWTGRDGAVVMETDGKTLHVHSRRAESATIQYVSRPAKFDSTTKQKN